MLVPSPLVRPQEILDPPLMWSVVPFESYLSGGSRIFPKGGTNSQIGIILQIFRRKLHENERIWTPGGTSLAPPLDPPMTCVTVTL